jgi:hypothetical protein
VPLGLYRRAKALIGDAGIVDVTVLIGWFTMVSATLSAFDVPANAVGLDRWQRNARGGRHEAASPSARRAPCRMKRRH